MIQFQILSGQQAGHRWVARRFPARIGRAAVNDLRLEEAGVWDRHCEVGFDPEEGFMLTAQPDALLTVNQEPARAVRLRNGDSVELGSVQLRFWLGDPVIRTFHAREWFVWAMITSVCLGQVALVYWLLQ